ncbi:phage tail protein [Roseivirga sp.]|uniref:phage tail protein n=1 Tax=Roseivirga sp. TaxID=1964215 RepID=UPI003B516B93
MEGTIGEIRGFAGNFSPRTWAFCQGQLLAISQNSALFSILGTTYGGDGRTTFALPDLRGRIPIHSGTGPGLTPRPLGARAGTETNTMSYNQLPVHHHFVTGGVLPVSGTISAHMNVNNSAGSDSNPDDGYLGVEGGSLGLYEPNHDSSSLASGAIQVSTSGLAVDASTITLDNAGASQPINNIMPYGTLNWIICMFGIYPSRN